MSEVAACQGCGSTYEGGGQGSFIVEEMGQAEHSITNMIAQALCSAYQGSKTIFLGALVQVHYICMTSPCGWGPWFLAVGPCEPVFGLGTLPSPTLPPLMEDLMVLLKMAHSPISSQEKNRRSSMRQWLTYPAAYEPPAQISSINRCPSTLTHMNTPSHTLTHSLSLILQSFLLPCWF